MCTGEEKFPPARSHKAVLLAEAVLFHLPIERPFINASPPTISSFLAGEFVPIPNLPVISSQKSHAD